MSLWRNDRNQPLAAVHGASHSAVSDIAWSPDCRRLLFAAGDTVVAAELEPRELGGEAETPQQLAAARETVGAGVTKRRLSMKLPAGTPTPTPVVAPLPQPLPQRKRETETHETPVTRRRKKQVTETPVEPVETPAEVASFPAMSLTLPATLPFPAGDRVLTMQSLPLATSPAGDDESVTLLQTTSPAGTLLWSWLGQGVPALAAISPRVIAVVSRGGLLHLVSSEGQTLLPPLHLAAPPSALAVHSSPRGDRIAVLTTKARIAVWEWSRGNLQALADIDAGWLTSETPAVRFASWETLGVGNVLWSLPLGVWICPETSLHALSPYARAPSPRLDASTVSTSPMLAQLAAVAQLEGDLFRFRVLTPERSRFERCLAAYAGLLAEHADLRRLQALAAQMREMTAFVGARGWVKGRGSQRSISSRRSWCRSSRMCLRLQSFCFPLCGVFVGVCLPFRLLLSLLLLPIDTTTNSYPLILTNSYPLILSPPHLPANALRNRVRLRSVVNQLQRL